MRVEIKPIPDDDPMYFHSGYRIIRGPSDKWGIIHVQSNRTIVDFVFDGIAWLKDKNLIRFYKDGKYALCHFNNGDFAKNIY